jgi:hypothetical protein
MKEFDVFAKNQIDYAYDKRDSFKLAADLFTSIRASYNDFHAALVKSEDPNHGKADMQARDDARKTFEEKLRAFNNAYILHNPNVTNEDLVKMGFTPRKPWSKREPPKTYPNGIAKTGNPGDVKVVLEDSVSGKDALPDDADEAEVYFLVSDTPITNPADLKYWGIVTKARFTMTFDPALRGKTVYIAARWRNNRGTGSWGPVFSGIVA